MPVMVHCGDVSLYLSGNGAMIRQMVAGHAFCADEQAEA